MDYKNSLEKVKNKHKFYGNLKEQGALTLNDFDQIYNNVKLYLEDIKKYNYNFTLEELCNLLSITKMYANTYFIDKLDTLYITRSCKLLMYVLRSNDTNQIKKFAGLFNKDDRKVIAQLLIDSDYNNNRFKKKFEELNLQGERLLKKYFISENSIKRTIKEVFKKEVRTRVYIEGEKFIKTDYTDIDDDLIDTILNVGLIDANKVKEYFNIKADTQLHRILNRFEELEQLRIAVLNDNDNKANTVKYIYNEEVLKEIKRTLDQEKMQNEEYAQARYKREKLL